MQEKKSSTFIKLKRIMREINSISRTFFYICLCEALLSATIPFIGMIYGRNIVDGLVLGYPREKIFIYAIQMACITLVLLLFRVNFERLRIIKSRYIEDTLKEKVSLKSIHIPYDVMEKSDTMSMLEKASRGTNINGGICQLCQSICGIAQHIISLIYIVIIGSDFAISLSRDEKIHSKNAIYVYLGYVIMFGVILLSIYANKKIASTYAAISKKISDDTMEANRHYGYFFTFMTRYAQGKDIRLYDMSELIDEEMCKCTDDIYYPETENVKASIRNSTRTKVVNSFVEYAFYIYVGIQAVNGLITLGELTFYVGVLKLLSNSVNGMINTWVWIRLRCEFIYYWIEYMEIPEETNLGKKELTIGQGDIYTLELQNVSFCYPNTTEYVLKDISLVIKAGQRVAFVGINGAGKTTLVKLLCRLYTPTSGKILLNGIDINEYDYDSYTKLFSVVFQDFKLFSFGIDENVAASEEVNDAMVKDSLKKAGIYERIEDFKDGVKSVLFNNVDNGIEISGGEGQKISIARALYKDAPIVILDEPTSALDPVAENEIYESFSELVKGKTSIFISHRMSSCKFCSTIYVFEQGKIIQCGTHDDLLSEDSGRYAALWNAQAQYYQ